MDDLMSVFMIMDEGRNEEAKECALQSIERLDKKDDEYLKWLNVLGYIYCNLEEYDKAIEVYNQYIEISNHNSNVENLHVGFHQKAMVLRLKKEYNEALNYILKENEIITQYFKDDCLKLSVNEYEHGYLLFLMNDIEEATIHMEHCLDYALKTEDFISQACAYRGLAEIFVKGNEQRKANDYFDKAYELFIEANDRIGAEEINHIRKK